MKNVALRLGSILAPAALFLVTGSAAGAQPFACVASSGVPPTVRAPGLAERVGDLVLSCTGGVPTSAGVPVPQVDVRITMNSDVTVGLLDGDWTEALLMIDDPVPAAQRSCPSDHCTIDGEGDADGVDYSAPGAGPGAPPNVFQGLRVSANQIEWRGVPLDPSGNLATRILRITNVLVNAAELVPVPGPPGQSTMSVELAGPQAPPITNPSQLVAFVADELTFEVDGPLDLPSFPNHNDPASPGLDQMLVFAEQSAVAFLTRNTGTTPDAPDTVLPQDTPALLYFTESGFYNPTPVVDSDHFASAAGLASQGTRLSASFSEVPAGVRLFVTREELGDPTASGGGFAVLVEGADPNGAGGVVPPHSSPDDDGPWTEIALFEGSGMATWEIVGSNPFSIQEVRFGVAVVFEANPDAGLPGPGTALVTGHYAPLSSDRGASSVAPRPRFSEVGGVSRELTSIGPQLPSLDPFLFYRVRTSRGAPRFARFGPVRLADAFGAGDHDLLRPQALGLPADKNREGVFDAVSHLEEYRIRPRAKFEKRTDVRLVNQCGEVVLELKKPVGLLLPTAKDLAQPVDELAEEAHALDHFLCYQAKSQRKLADGTKLPKFPKGVQVRVTDQFDAEDRLYDLKKVTKLCSPVAKSGTPLIASGPDKGAPFPITPAAIRSRSEHLVCYRANLARRAIEQNGCGPADPAANGTVIAPRQTKHAKRAGIYTNNQFGPEQLDTKKEVELCIPSRIPQDLTPCEPAVRDVWSFEVEAGQTVRIRADTVGASTAANLCFVGDCEGANAFAGDEDFACAYRPPEGSCPAATFIAAGNTRCAAEVTVCSPACVDPATASYTLQVELDGIDAELELTADDAP